MSAEVLKEALREIEEAHRAVRRHGRPSEDLDLGYDQGIIDAKNVLRRLIGGAV